ncbi:MAG: apolipoprotein N-acyltransferase [Acidimicrobiaceae bacterium]|nr:apolipoprotein N-acyltransferase [Acidimicrobiaceae bacterium]
MAKRRPRSLVVGLGAVGAGGLVAASLPPWGFWPAAWIGFAVLDRVLGTSDGRSRFARGWLFGLGWFAPGLGWMWFLTAPGYLAAVAVFAAFVGTACALVPPSPWRRLALPGALTLTEAIRFVFPLGGVPLASVAIGQAGGPLAPVVRVGGALLLGAVTIGAGVAISAAFERRRLVAAAGAAAVVVLTIAGYTAPAGHSVRTVVVALVQGGGRQGTHAVNTDPRLVVERALAATATLAPGADVVVWPENVIDVAAFATSRELDEVASEAARLHAPLVVGITEDAGPKHFTNAQVVVLPDGDIVSRYDKVKRVPFGEYIPLRGILNALGAPTDRVPTDAVAGHGPGVLDIPGLDRVGVVISWEVFFDDQARGSVTHGAALILNPTNGSSYTGTELQTQQLASSRLRALETGRWVVQVAPTGFSAFVSPSGRVFDRTTISAAATRTRTVSLRHGRTLYVVVGDLPAYLLAAALVITPRSLEARNRRAKAKAPA